MMTRIVQIESVRKYYPKAVGKRLKNYHYGVLDQPHGNLIAEAHTKRDAWIEALRKVRGNPPPDAINQSSRR